jgi:STE24 endopeptidase
MEVRVDSASSVLNAGFTHADLSRAREYRRPLYLVGAAGLALECVLLALAAFGPLGRLLFTPFESLPWWGAALAYPALLVLVLTLVALPLRVWAGWARERRYGLSHQSLSGWATDRAKALVVELVLSSLALGGLIVLAHKLPDAWPLVAAPAAAGLVVLLSFVAPVVLEPLFNRFRPVEDRALAESLRGLAARAGVPIREVLVADASRRTTRQNAYVSGLGRTRRVVVFDTLLEDADRRRLQLVVAHELGHRRERHVAKVTAGAALGSAAAVIALWALLRWQPLLDAVGASGAGDPRIVPFVLLSGLLLQLVSLPPVSWVSRRFERVADRASLDLTGDLEAFESAHRELARSNLSDLDPPRAVYYALFSHPTPPERIATARTWGAGASA